MDSQTGTLLFSLPLELRQIIYKESFHETEVYIRLDNNEYSYPGRRCRAIPSNILFACKQAYGEAIEVYYKTSTFEFPGFEQAVEWIGGDVIPKQIAALIKHVTIWIDCARVCKEVGCAASLELVREYYGAELTKEVLDNGVVLKNVEVKLKVFSWGRNQMYRHGCACRQVFGDNEA